MAHTEGFYIDDDVSQILKANCSKRGDKSKLINEAIKKFFNNKVDNNENYIQPQILVERV